MTSLRACRSAALVLLAAALAATAALLSGTTLEPTVGQIVGVRIGLRLDVLSVILLSFVSCVGWLVATYSLHNLRGQARTGRFGALLLAALAALTLLVTGASLPVIAIGWTASGLALAALVAHPATPSARRAARYVRRSLLVGDAALWTAVIAAVALLPTVNRAELGDATITPGAATLVAGLLVAASLVRSALVPAQSWLPETAEAPSPVSAFLHAGIVNGAGVLGCLMWPVLVAAPGALGALFVVGAASVVVGTLAARVRTDVKGQLACSTTAQMGYMSVQLGLGLPAAAVLHLVGHGFYKAWLFLRAGGAVTRNRWKPVASASGAPAHRARTAAAVLVGSATALALAAPAAAHSVSALGVTALVPPVLALVTAVVAMRALGRANGVSWSVAIAAAVASGTAVAAYAWLLAGWEELLAPALPLRAVWSTPTAAALVGALVVVAVVLARLATVVERQPAGATAVRLSGTTLPPWARTVPGTATWPHVTPVAAVGVALDAAEAEEFVRLAAQVTAPAWPLRTLVAANPLAGLESLDFAEANTIGERLYGTHGYLPLANFAELADAGRITREDLLTAARIARFDRGSRASASEFDDQVDAMLVAARHATEPGDASSSTSAVSFRRFTEAVDAVSGGRTELAATADQHAAAWCQRAWSRALGGSTGPWALWRTAATQPAYDRALRLRGVSAMVSSLPAEPAEALAGLLARTGLDGDALVEYVCRLLTSAPGWAAHAAWRARMGTNLRPLVELAALRAALDLIVAGSAASEVDRADLARPSRAPDEREDEHLEIWQLAYELGFRDDLTAKVRANARELLVEDVGGTPAAGPAARADAQLVFCIDVRSERIRRGVEATGAYRTYGFAGFFGAMMQYESPTGAHFEQVPALVRPDFAVTDAEPITTGLREALRQAVLAASTAPVTPLLVAEAGGMLAGLAATSQTLTPARWHRLAIRWGALVDGWGPRNLTTTRGEAASIPSAVGLPIGMTTAEQVELAAGALQAIGLVEDFAPLLIVCGHAATVENNAFSAAYDCGACGGNGGQLNARVLAAALNDHAVRVGLAEEGIVIPADTVAVAAVHDTTTDEVRLDPAAPASHAARLARLAASLRTAGHATRTERAATLPGAPTTPAPAELAAHVAQRATDWSQPAPEWGLAGNAAFVVGPRELTAGLDLEGRVFLHSYDPRLDTDGAILDTILTAPAVVTQWISSQYYASTVDHRVFGAGDKATHNVVGDVGVLTGAHGDLRMGLPWQALFETDPRRAEHPTTPSRHEPLRELVLVWARPGAITAVIAAHPDLQALVTGGWMALAAIDPEDGNLWRLNRSLSWRPWHEPVGVELATAPPTDLHSPVPALTRSA